ncbi:Pyruvate dehydrogenase complex negative regulator [Komagataella phaffii CBS 7435]|uniref:Protein-serine/threonine kinase n=2 Tax=Komagataella phaffii TaxID=460519 RepID=C4R8U4_KOMPG|nr:Mitochondrial protein kinase [Komagataella phaffii GS115]AOA64932.1 GQ67_05138T0 [Komagataella phaffii]CAH2450575.1 Pyruvate dehydrogenase complex negative regulator [Komagataella phaffii CBS 7435]AOA70231.1 GQ68_05120T0 [Komagataella phaffii GS115]CAY72019.1 Mitochondrial protein kinase [Komagataella phaffii GS115]CCA40379.1 Pyruvate dehydrogenase complex negative regulator [Komagataella phaffii CBS 7435]
MGKHNILSLTPVLRKLKVQEDRYTFDRILAYYAKFHQAKLSLKQIAQFGQTPSTPQIFRSSVFLLDELPVRLSKRITLLRNPPEIIRERGLQAPFLEWARTYEKTFVQVLKFKRAFGFMNNEDEISRLVDRVHSEHSYSNVTPITTELKNRLLKESDVSGTLMNKDIDNDGFSVFGLIGLKSLASNSAEVSGLKKYLQVAYRSHTEIHSYLEEVATLFQLILKNHSNDILSFTKLLMEHTGKKQLSMNEFDNQKQIHRYLNMLFSSRIGTRVLLAQHLQLYKMSTGKLRSSVMKQLQHQGMTGVIGTKVVLYDIINDAIYSAEEALNRYLQESNSSIVEPPEFELNCDPDLTVTCIPAHLWHVVFEVCKNSLRATVDNHIQKGDTSKQMHPIVITVLEGTDDVVIKIADRGGGISPEVLKHIWSYHYSTNNTVDAVQKLTQSEKDQYTLVNSAQQGAEDNAPMAGLGFGLPLSKLMIRHYGNGDLHINNLYGYGCEVFITLNKRGDGVERKL